MFDILANLGDTSNEYYSNDPDDFEPGTLAHSFAMKAQAKKEGKPIDPLADLEVLDAVCKHCEEEFIYYRRPGQIPKYCKPVCRQLAYVQRKADKKRAKQLELARREVNVSMLRERNHIDVKVRGMIMLDLTPDEAKELAFQLLRTCEEIEPKPGRLDSLPMRS